MDIVSRLKPKYLELFIKIAETGQLQLAAKAVAISQPGASRTLHELERQTNSQLFIRHPTGMELTQAGKVFLRHARVVLAELGALESELEGVRSGTLGHVRVGAVTGPTVGHLMPAVQEVLEEAPDLRISIDVAPSRVLFRGLEEARYAFILGRADPRHNPADFRFHPGRTEKLALMVHRTHPLAGKKQVDLADLHQFPWVIQEEGSPIRSAVEAAFYAEDLPVPPRILNSSSLLVVLAQIENGLAIAPQTEEVMRLLSSKRTGANVTSLSTKAPMVVAPYFVIQDTRRKLTRAEGHLLESVMARF